MVLGLPLGRVVGELLGWRITFFAIGALAAVETLFLWKILPFLPSRRAGSLASLSMFARHSILLALYLLTFLIVGAHFTTYSYIEPFVAKFNPAGDHFVTYVLLAFGASGIAASVLFQSFTALFRMLFDLRDPLYPSLGADAKSFCRRERGAAARDFRLGSGDF